MPRYKKGQSGNLKGKPVGAKSRYTRLREALVDDLPALLDKTKEAALNGDMVAMRLLLERTLPTTKAAAATVDIPELAEADTLTNKATAILTAIARGQLPPDIGGGLLTALGQMAKIAEVDEIERRITVLEGLNCG